MSRRRIDLGAAEGRALSSSSVYSMILLNYAIRGVGDKVRSSLGDSRSVVDVGCGEAPYVDLLAPTFYLGVDREIRHMADGFTTMADALKLPVRDSSFDCVLCTEVIEHVSDEHALCGELARVAKAGAVMVLSSPFVHGLHEMPHDYRRLTSLGLVSALESTGWELDEMTSVGGPFVVAVDSFARWVNQSIRSFARRYLREGSLLHRVALRLTVVTQKLLAVAVLSLPSVRMGPVDPELPAPRLTLGYIVVARLTGSATWTDSATRSV